MLSVKNLTKTFDGITAVDDASFEARGGEIFGLLGPNGAGKTTTIRLIATVLTPTSGTATVGGFDVLTQAQDVRKHVGILTADIGLYDRFTARENLRYFGKLYSLEGAPLEKRIDDLIEIMDMKRFADRRAGQFSTGMKQKVAIARSIIHDPDVVIFDEPTAGLDVLASQTVIAYMLHAREQGKLVVLSTHDMAHAQQLCDRVAIMHRSKIVALDTQQALLSRTNAKNLEEVFLAIVGEDAAKHVEHEHEERQLRNAGKKKRGLFKL
ncbi:MAG: ATP-binding cassette domain-containing protein [Patescibacteria group bacterium]